MKVRDAMNPDACVASPDDTAQQAAILMAENDIASLPVVDEGRLAGMVSDRDIALNVVAEGRSASTCVRDVMTSRAIYCIDDEDVDDVLSRMAMLASNRLPVVDHGGKLVGILIRR
jgi:CBS domain-containing protein